MFGRKSLPKFLIQASKVAKFDNDDKRNFKLGCIGIRKDGTIVSARNAPSMLCIENGSRKAAKLLPNTHAEWRTLNKMDYCGILYVARVNNNGYAMARPCEMCAIKIKSMHVKKVYYTINNQQYGVWDVVNDTDTVYNI